MHIIKLKASWLVVLTLFSAHALDKFPSKAPIPADNPQSSDKIELGRQLFVDVRLSLDNTVSCNTCHNVHGSGTDNLPTSKGVGGKFGGRNSPTVWNAALHSVQFWDGRAATLEEQAKGPLTNPIEMANPNHQAVVERVQSIPEYARQFQKVFGKDGVTIDNIAKAIASFERTLLTPQSPYDQFMSGKTKALSAEAKKGMELFQSVGCVSCHMGSNFSGPPLPTGTGFYQKFPRYAVPDLEKKYEFSKDLGRFEVSKNESEKNMWRVPNLRNIELTAPYFHNGRVTELSEAVKIMAKAQLNRDLSDEETAALVAFLKSLTGKRPNIKSSPQ